MEGLLLCGNMSIRHGNPELSFLYNVGIFVKLTLVVITGVEEQLGQN